MRASIPSFIRRINSILPDVMRVSLHGYLDFFARRSINSFECML